MSSEIKLPLKFAQSPIPNPHIIYHNEQIKKLKKIYFILYKNVFRD